MTKVLHASAAVDETMSEVAMRAVDIPSVGTTASAMEPRGRAMLYPD